MSDEGELDEAFDQGYVLGSLRAARSILGDLVDPLEFIKDDADLKSRLLLIIQKLEEFHAAVLTPPEQRKPDDPDESVPPHGEPITWSLRGRETLEELEVAMNLSAVIGEVVLGAEITVTKFGHPVARIVPAGPVKRFDPAEVRGYTELIQPHDRPTVEFVREMRARERF